MNVALRAPDGSIYLYSVLKVPRTEAGYEIRGLRLESDGTAADTTLKTVFASRKQAESRIRILIGLKKRKKKCVEVPISELPPSARKLLAPDLDGVMDSEDFKEMVYQVENERNVMFLDVVGLEGVFQEGVKYKAHVDARDPEMLLVHGPDGSTHHCFKDRFLLIETTEKSDEVQKAMSSGMLARIRAERKRDFRVGKEPSVGNASMYRGRITI